MKTQLQANAQGDLPLLQITDTHLFSDINKDLMGVKTMRSYKTVVEHALKYSSICEAMLATGDLSQDHSPQSYSAFTKYIKKLNLPCYWLPGNHDMQAVMLPSLLAQGLAKTQQIISDHWQIIMLDSQVETLPYGELDEQQLDFLQQALNEYPDKYALICLHHHVLPSGAKWLDQHILKNSAIFLEVVSSFKNVCAVLSGHVHQASDVLFNGIRFLTTPSTCVQFKPNSDDFAVDTQAPGYRYLSLNKEGDISTCVERVEQCEFSVDAEAKGY